MSKYGFIRINGKDAPASEDVYYALKRPVCCGDSPKYVLDSEFAME